MRRTVDRRAAPWDEPLKTFFVRLAAIWSFGRRDRKKIFRVKLGDDLRLGILNRGPGWMKCLHRSWNFSDSSRRSLVEELNGVFLEKLKEVNMEELDGDSTGIVARIFIEELGELELLPTLSNGVLWKS